MINTFIFMGRPGAGKGAQAELLSKKLGFPIFSTGNKVREISKEDSTIGQKIKVIEEAGELTPYWFASYLFEQALFTKKAGEGIIFEGVGRKEPEAKLFAEINNWLENDFRIVHLNISEDTTIKRLLKRKEIENRADDTEDKIRVRLHMFDTETQAALDYFRSIGKVIEIDGEPVQDIVFKEVLAALEPYDHA